MIDAYASQDRFAVHVAPVWDALGPEVRGQWGDPSSNPTIVASYGDLRRARRSRPKAIVHMEHGAGQSYSNTHSSYPGGRDHADVGLFLVPNQHAGDRWQAAYPKARVEVVGSPHAEALPQRDLGPGPVVAISFHGSFAIVPETQSAFPVYASVIPALAKRFTLIGHAHPIFMPTLRGWYQRNSVEVVDTFEEVCRRADVYVVDNSSTLFEFASTGRPVVVLNQPKFRRGVAHGLRFWDASTVGVNCDQPADLIASVERALADESEQRQAREAALNVAYTVRSGAANLAAAAITDWLQ